MDRPNIDFSDLTDQTIFLSYRSRDEPEVHGLAVLLENLGNKVVRMGNFPAGRWSDHIYDMLEKSDTLLVYLSHAPKRTVLRVITQSIGKGVVSAFKYLTRRPSEPSDWMKEEYDHFKKLHGEDRKVIVYAEEDAEQPDYLRDQQMHFYVSQLTELRKKWKQLMDDKVGKSDARRIMIKELKEQGINIGPIAGDAVVDMFGVHGVKSWARFVWHRSRASLAFAPLVFALLLLVAGTFTVSQTLANTKIEVPNIVQVPINLAQTGTSACEAQSLVCVSVSQTTAFLGQVDDNDFYGYASPTCTSQVRRSNTCKQGFGTDFEITNVKYQRSENAETAQANIAGKNFCIAEPLYENANCVSPIGK